ncbi:hypothetical protein CONPUDRAFT_47905, partial [Coniophora puteana RWD-64-598 SS2]
YAPKQAEYMRNMYTKILHQDPDLVPALKHITWPAMSFNYGGNVVTNKHVDCMNLPQGWCAIWAGGDYDPTQGGHLILWELGLVIEFPPSSVILIPSSIVPHGNIAIQPNETRVSMTHFCPGGLARWVHADFRPMKSLSQAERQEVHGGEGNERWSSMVSLFSTMDTLISDREALKKQ